MNEVGLPDALGTTAFTTILILFSKEAATHLLKSKLHYEAYNYMEERGYALLCMTCVKARNRQHELLRGSPVFVLDATRITSVPIHDVTRRVWGMRQKLAAMERGDIISICSPAAPQQGAAVDEMDGVYHITKGMGNSLSTLMGYTRAPNAILQLVDMVDPVPAPPIDMVMLHNAMTNDFWGHDTLLIDDDAEEKDCKE